VRLHRQARAFLLKPSAAVTGVQLNKIHGTIVLVGPFAFLQPVNRDVHQDDAARPQDRFHAPIVQSDAAVPMMTVLAIQNIFDAATCRRTPRDKFRAV
jgi:hypothetical protein